MSLEHSRQTHVLNIQNETLAFEQLILQYYQPLLRFVARQLKDASYAPDVVQEVFIKVFHSLPELRQHASVQAWLYQIALNTSRDYLSDQLSDPLNFYSDEEWMYLLDQIDESWVESDPFDEVYVEELKKYIFNIIQNLPEDLKSSLIYREFMDLSYDEIAQLMSCPVGTVRSRLSRAREMVLQKII